MLPVTFRLILIVWMEFASETDKAAMLIENELEIIREKFESGELKAFGKVEIVV